ncbi:TetR/AcrR family transcriptional regulator [Couchioplanes azureus]|uniref:TetR/AcrR family transcriptional regulator n=1 Tax=Couchioplanes caeruleus TaxID=56438 RepID=UPI00166FEEDF|nr:TetR/AcrR family transcriptional regulator [Couchioplanes caeruleus]
MAQAPTAPDRRSSPARQRLLDAAARVFYAEGIHAVGVDRIITEAGVTRATFYHHFRSKDELVAAYLDERDRAVRARVTAADPGGDDPRAILGALAAGITEEMCEPGFRGCAFINAAAEYPDPDHPVSRVIAGHRAWFRAALADYLARAGHPDPHRVAGILVMLRDGAMVSGHLEGPETVRANFTAAVLGVLQY